MQVHLYDFRWLDEHNFELQASLNHQFAKKPLKIGDNLSIQIQSDIRCSGSFRDGVFKACPDRITGKKKCDTCRNREGGFIFTSFDGFNTDNYTPEDLSQIQGPHVVYLALFDTHLVKVGVSKIDRKTLRQIEQGSEATLYIAQTDNGVSARQIETLFRKSGIIDKVNASAKKDFICPDITTKEAEKKLIETFEKHKNCLAEYEHLQTFLLLSPEFYMWEELYGLSALRKSDKSFHSVKLENGESVSGKIIAARGAFIVLELPHELVSICAKDLIGRQIEFDLIPPGLQMNQALQGALF